VVSQRWQIEVLHKVLKSGCKVEQRQMETANGWNEPCRSTWWSLGASWPCARRRASCRMIHQRLAARRAVANALVLCASAHLGAKTSPRYTRRSVDCTTGRLLARKSDGEPGTTTLWRGLHQLEAMTKMWELCHTSNGGRNVGNASALGERAGVRGTVVLHPHAPDDC